MTFLEINLGFWIFFFIVSLMLVLIGICLGTPGGGKLKKSLVWYCLMYGFCLASLCVMHTFVEAKRPVPVILEMIWSVVFNLLSIALMNLFYAVAEKKKGLHYKFVAFLTAIGIGLTLAFEEFYAIEGSGRLWLPAIHQSIATAGCLWFLYVSYKGSDLKSTKRKRIVIVFWYLFAAIFLAYLPLTVLVEVMGWADDRFLSSAFVQLGTGTSFFVAFGLLIVRYNLVKVELDQVGEGLFRDIDTPILLLSREHAILRSNPKADEMFELEKLLAEPEEKRNIERLLPSFEAGRSKFDVTMDTRQGSKEFECTMSAVYQMDEVLGGILVLHDVTRERELARMKTEFTSTVSHELRTPLTSILGFAKLIERRFREVILLKYKPETKKENRAVGQINKNLGVIISESNRLTKLINDVLDISKMEAGKVDWNFAQCSSYSIIEQAINATNGLFVAKPAVELMQEIPEDLPSVVADADRIVQVVINLISNAVKFTDAGQIKVQVEKKWSSLVVSVHDQGTGISEADQKLVFEKYKQVGDVITDKPTGTGLGLPISKEIVERHGGKIWVKSKIGEGSVFAFSLPLATVVDTAFSSIGVQEFISQLHQVEPLRLEESASVLIIDDDAAIREMLSQMFEEAGYETLEAGDGIAGLEAVRTQQPDIIILDVMMPRLNGFDCAAAIKSDPMTRHIPILMLTVIDNAQRAFGLGVGAYLTKPFEEEQVLSEVKRLLTKRTQKRRVVVLGQRADSQSVIEQLKQTAAHTTHLEEVQALEAALAEQGPDLALVVGEDFQDEEIRLQIQRIVGTRACMVMYIDPTAE